MNTTPAEEQRSNVREAEPNRTSEAEKQVKVAEEEKNAKAAETEAADKNSMQRWVQKQWRIQNAPQNLRWADIYGYDDTNKAVLKRSS